MMESLAPPHERWNQWVHEVEARPIDTMVGYHLTDTARLYLRKKSIVFNGPFTEQGLKEAIDA